LQLGQQPLDLIGERSKFHEPLDEPLACQQILRASLGHLWLWIHWPDRFTDNPSTDGVNQNLYLILSQGNLVLEDDNGNGRSRDPKAFRLKKTFHVFDSFPRF